MAGATSRLAYQQVSDAGDTGISHEPHTPTPLLIDFTTETDTTLNALGEASMEAYGYPLVGDALVVVTHLYQ